MFNQTEAKYKSIMLGNGTGSIYQYGCYLVSLCNGLKQKGYGYTPEELNDILKAKGLWIGPYGNYIDVANLHIKWPEIFESFEQVDPWGATPKTDTLINNQLIALGKVSAKPIGGTGDHYVLITASVNEVARIYDPWSKVEELITKRWASFGYILGLRLFKVKPHVEAPPPAPIPTPEPPQTPPSPPEPVPTPEPPNTPPDPLIVENQRLRGLVQAIHDVIWGAGWWYKWPQIRVLLPK